VAAHSNILKKVESFASKAVHGLKKEHDLLQTLHHDVEAALARCGREDPGLKTFLKHAHGYAIFPSLGQAAAVIGGAFGKGEVFERGKLIGYAGLVQVSLGVQIGGQTLTEIIAFQNRAALSRFKEGKFSFTATAAAALVKAGAAATSRYDNGVAVLLHSDGGMMLELALAAQKFIYADAFMGRGESATKPS